jgi:predicted Zn-dependent protease
LKPYSGTQQYPAEEIIAIAKKVIPNFQDVVPTSSFVVLTRRDINSGDRSLCFNFASGEPTSRVVVVSTARLALNLKNTNIGRDVFWLRTYKMTKREIGIVHFGYPRSTDVKDLMYSPIMSLKDVDRMGTEFAAAKK